MNTKLLFTAFMAVAVMTGCCKDYMELDIPEGKTVNLEVRLPSQQTRAVGTDEENKINDLQVFVFDHNGMLEAYDRADGSSLSLSCSSGVKEVVALVNAGPLSDVVSLVDLEGRRSGLADNSPGSFVMEGRATPTLRASSTVVVPVSRLAARVALTEVAVDFELAQHNSQTFQIKAVYLLNVAGDRTYLTATRPDVWYNKMTKDSAAPSITGVTLTNAYVTSSTPYNTVHYLYGYPNPTTSDVSGGSWSARFTRLVVEAELGGKLYYYPVTLEGGLKSNTSYDVKLKITRPGSSSPDKPVDSVTASFSVEVQPWNDGISVNETI